MIEKKVIRCSDSNCNHGNGNILLVFDADKIYVKCRNSSCKLFTRLTVKIPGINVDFSTAGIVQDTLPPDYHLDFKPASTVVVE